MAKKDTKKQEPTKKEKNTVRQGQKSKTLSTQRYMQFAEAHDDTLLLVNGGIRAILEVSSINFNLKSPEEQDAIILSYQQFLNSLNFPVQILVKSRKLDIDQYLENLRGRRKDISNSLLKNQMSEYIEYISRLVEHADIMEKKFYIVIPQNPLRAEPKNGFAKFIAYIKPDDTVVNILRRKREFSDLKKQLDTRVNIVTTALENCNLKVKRLNTAEIIETYYQSYNPQLSRIEKFDKVEDLGIETDITDMMQVQE